MHFSLAFSWIIYLCFAEIIIVPFIHWQTYAVWRRSDGHIFRWQSTSTVIIIIIICAVSPVMIFIYHRRASALSALFARIAAYAELINKLQLHIGTEPSNVYIYTKYKMLMIHRIYAINNALAWHLMALCGRTNRLSIHITHILYHTSVCVYGNAKYKNGSSSGGVCVCVCVRKHLPSDRKIGSDNAISRCRSPCAFMDYV